MDGFQDLLFKQSLAHLKDVRCLDSLVQAHVLLAVMAERTSPEYQLNLLKAFTFVLQIWQVLPPLLSQEPTLLTLFIPKLFCGECGKYSFAECLSLQVSMAMYSQISPETKHYQEPLASPSSGSRKGNKVKNVKPLPEPC